MATPTQMIQKMLKEFFKKFSKTPYAVPASIALSCGVYYLVMAYVSAICLSNLLAPVFLIGMLWGIGIKGVKKLLIIGAIATLFFSAILAMFIVDHFQHIENKVALSEDGQTLSGTVSPWSGGKSTLFTYSLNVSLNNITSVVDSAHLLIFGLGFPSASDHNYTMTPVSQSVNNVTNKSYYNFSYTTTLSHPINEFVFRVNISGAWMYAGDYNSLGQVTYIQGPVYKDSLAVAAPIIPYALQSNYIYVFGPYAIICGMIWWTRRARRMRERQLEKWETERAKEEAEKPKTERKVARTPSLATAMGKEEETFVCSECGADVPADATVCPKCGEKFD